MLNNYRLKERNSAFCFLKTRFFIIYIFRMFLLFLKFRIAKRLCLLLNILSILFCNIGMKKQTKSLKEKKEFVWGYIYSLYVKRLYRKSNLFKYFLMQISLSDLRIVLKFPSALLQNSIYCKYILFQISSLSITSRIRGMF